MELSFLKEGISLIVKEQGGKKKKNKGEISGGHQLNTVLDTL